MQFIYMMLEFYAKNNYRTRQKFRDFVTFLKMYKKMGTPSVFFIVVKKIAKIMKTTTAIKIYVVLLVGALIVSHDSFAWEQLHGLVYLD